MFNSDIFHLQFIQIGNSGLTLVIFEPGMFNSDIFHLQFIRIRNSGITLAIFEPEMFNSNIYFIFDSSVSETQAVVKVIYESGEEEHSFAEEWIVLNLKKRSEVLIYSIKMVKFTAEELSRIMDL
ncbi:hypothetical protein C5167_019841 [Papaver somniferum]|uniref:Uncharacterized protein n=1 Tax=Papaver somniferum TaxID=3469 RepID=A0A4Y7IV87_PAPSO|nr:hypothetical protein C5167_019841 [Papaver somniferum]